MVNVGLVRKIDGLGRIVIAAELRRTMGLTEGTPIEVFTEGEYIMLKKYSPSCIFCGEAREVVNYKGKNICTKCRNELRE